LRITYPIPKNSAGDLGEPLVRGDLEAILGFCRTNRGEYDATPNEQALWLRIRNTIESENNAVETQTVHAAGRQRDGFWQRLLGHSWQLSFPQLAASVAAIALVVALTTVVGMRRFESGPTLNNGIAKETTGGFDFNGRKWQQQQAIRYWNARIETKRARWNPQMRDTFVLVGIVAGSLLGLSVLFVVTGRRSRAG
jgi:hypothetical protein